MHFFCLKDTDTRFRSKNHLFLLIVIYSVPIEKDSSNQANSLKGERKEGTERERVQADDEEDFDQHEELQEAVQLLSRAVECLGALINKEIASAADKMSSRDEAESQAGQHTVDPLGASSKIIFDQEEVAEGNDVSNGDDEGISGRGGIVETLAVQLAGVLHKLVQGIYTLSMLSDDYSPLYVYC